MQKYQISRRANNFIPMCAISLTTLVQEWLSMSMRKWAALIYIGKRIKEDVLYNRRADYGKQVIKNLSLRLTERYGKGWSEKTLRHCLRAAETFSEADIVSAVQRQFNWTQLKVASLFLSVRHEIQSCLTALYQLFQYDTLAYLTLPLLKYKAAVNTAISSAYKHLTGTNKNNAKKL